jgi:hypothetical protein
VLHLARSGRSGGGDNSWMGDGPRTVAKAVGNLAVTGVMCRETSKAIDEILPKRVWANLVLYLLGLILIFLRSREFYPLIPRTLPISRIDFSFLLC